MNKLKKDFVIVYLARNALATLIITICAFGYDFTSYFKITWVKVLVKIFLDNFYTTVYFLLLWILNYLLFELYKIIIDFFRKNGKKHAKVIIDGKEIVSYGIIFPLVMLIGLLIIDFNQLFRANFILLSVFMLLRAIKEELKHYKK